MKEDFIDWEQVEGVVRACPMICCYRGEDDMLLVHCAILANAPLEVISLMVDSYPSYPTIVRDGTYPSHREWLPLHLACITNNSVEVIAYLSKTFRETWHIYDDAKKTPLMHVLAAERGLDVIHCVSASCMEYFGIEEPRREYCEWYDVFEETQDWDRGLFRLQNKDPSLFGIQLDDCAGMVIRGEGEVLDVLHAILHHSNIEFLHLGLKEEHSFLWAEGDGRNALIQIMRESAFLRSVTVKISEGELSTVGLVIGNCHKIEQLEIICERGYFYDRERQLNDCDRGLSEFSESLMTLSFLNDITTHRIDVNDERARVLCATVFKMRSMKSITFIDAWIGESEVNIILEALRKDVDHTFTTVDLFCTNEFIRGRPNPDALWWNPSCDWKWLIKQELNAELGKNHIKEASEKRDDWVYGIMHGNQPYRYIPYTPYRDPEKHGIFPPLQYRGDTYHEDNYIHHLHIADLQDRGTPDYLYRMMRARPSHLHSHSHLHLHSHLGKRKKKKEKKYEHMRLARVRVPQLQQKKGNN
jgi:hypothetical protein